MYPKELQKSLKAVEVARQYNIQNEPRRMSEDEKQSVVSANHPDFFKGGFAKLKIGVNKGDSVPYELASLLEANSRIQPNDVDVVAPTYDVDVLIIGGGGAGAAAAIEADNACSNVMLVTKLRFGDSNTIMAKGGLQSACGANDDPAQHFIDSYGGGHFTAKRELLAKLVNNAPQAIQWLSDLGVEFDKYPDGTMITTHGGGTSRKRMHSVKDHTGLEIMHVLRDEVVNRHIKVLEYTAVVELLLDESGDAAGAVLMDMDTGEYTVVRSKTVIIATGGAGRLHYQGFPTTNHYGATADGLVLAYRAGAKLIFADSEQYHPTGAAHPAQIFGALVTEKARALGAKLVNRNGKVFINSLEERDVVTSAIIRECLKWRNGVRVHNHSAIWLDTPMIDIIHGKGATEKLLPSLLSMYLSCGIDIRREPILVYPTLHYQNGGIEIDAESESVSVKKLFVAGEAAGGIHGRNRLMGNSLLDVIVFGRIAGRNAANRAKSTQTGTLTLEHIVRFDAERELTGIFTDTVSPKLLPNYIGMISEV